MCKGSAGVGTIFNGTAVKDVHGRNREMLRDRVVEEERLREGHGTTRRRGQVKCV